MPSGELVKICNKLVAYRHYGSRFEIMQPFGCIKMLLSGRASVTGLSVSVGVFQQRLGVNEFEYFTAYGQNVVCKSKK
jgi:hypothetical protein